MNYSKYNFGITENKNVKENFSYYKISNSKSTILMPPPNITGNLHLGHSLDLVIQDFIVRTSFILRKEKVFWISGFDHAGIATQSKIESLGFSLTKEEKKKFAIEN